MKRGCDVMVGVVAFLLIIGGAILSIADGLGAWKYNAGDLQGASCIQEYLDAFFDNIRDLSVDGNATVASNLTVTGTVTASGLLDSDTTGVTGDFSVGTNATVGGTLGVNGVATFTAESVHNGGIDADYLTTDAAAGVDTKTAGALKLGAATATSVELGASDCPVATAGTFQPVRFLTTTITTNAYTITSANYGTMILVNTNAAVAITLPANGAAAGAWVDVAVYSAASDDCAPTISAATTDTLIGPNDVDLDSITWATGHRIGAQAKFWSDGAFWHVQNLGGTTMTYTD